MSLTFKQRMAKKARKVSRTERVSERMAREAEAAERRAKELLEIPPTSSASRYPIFECRQTADLFDRGLGYVTVARQLPDGKLLVGCFLVDVQCLGVKDAFKRRFDREAYNHLLNNMPTQPVAPDHACKLVDSAVRYAATFNLRPHPDYAEAREVLSGIDCSACQRDFTFGDQGRPHYWIGPNDTRQRVSNVLQRLREAVGPEGFLLSGPGWLIDRDLAPTGMREVEIDESDDEEEDLDEYPPGTNFFEYEGEIFATSLPPEEAIAAVRALRAARAARAAGTYAMS